jgi:hypothetical protein
MEIPEEYLAQQPDTDVTGQRNANHQRSNELPNGNSPSESLPGDQGTSGGDSNKSPGDDLNMAVDLEGRDAFTILQAQSQHVMEFNVAGWKLKHPLLCREHLFTCPFTYATRDGVSIRPGTSGHYECTLDERGDVRLGRRVFTNDQLLDTAPMRNGINGHAR